MRKKKIWNTQTQIVVILLALTGGAIYSWNKFRHEPRSAEVQNLARHSSALAAANQAAREAIGQLGVDSVITMTQVYDNFYSVLEPLLPSDTTSSALQPAIAQLATEYDVTLTNLEPAERIRGEVYDTESYHVSARGRYHDLGAFLAALGSLSRIVRVTNLDAEVTSTSNSQAGGPSAEHFVNIEFTLESYLRGTALPDTTSKVQPRNSNQFEYAYERDSNGRIWQLIIVPGKSDPIRVPAPQGAMEAAQRYLSNQ